MQSVFQSADEHAAYHGIYREPSEDGYIPYPLNAAKSFPGDGEATADSVFSGIGTFSHLPYGACLSKKAGLLPDLGDVANGDHYDIAFLGAPFDTGTSYRPGARFGPAGIRQGSRRLNLYGGYNVPLDVNPFRDWAKVIDCGDVPVSPYDSHLAMEQIEKGHRHVLHKKATTQSITTKTGLTTKTHTKALYSKDGTVHPRIITLGGDHTITLPALRSIHSIYGPVSVIHFDSHLDTWRPSVFGAGYSETASVNHGTYFWHAAQEGLIRNGSSVHAGIRTTLSGPSDYAVDKKCGFHLNEARIIDDIGTDGIIRNIRKVVEGNPVYLSIDIDVLDPASAPATGTPESGGWSTRELRRIIRGLEGLDLVGADIVEVAPPFDNQAEVTQIAAADILLEVMSLMVKRGPLIEI
ncbi:agmatinase [Malassezia nana]|uniref:agmatinase n=1 Tax=Malassezia nana TaxID=180528 RepID=A0AAF0ENV2_9BASI|nr:agmatinase [Malassezia nana]